jgi:Metal-dependent hydrolase
MKKILYLLIALVLFSCKSQEEERSLELNVMTFNVRLDTTADKENSWSYRKDNAAEMIKADDVDILGMQEVLYNQLTDLKERLPEYNSVGVGRFDGKEAGEYSPVFYRESKFDEYESGNFWLSEDPTAVGVKGWDAACERIASWAILKDKSTGKRLFVLCTHFDHIGETARRESAHLILSKVKELSQGLPVIVMGDFNADSESEVVKIITDENDPLHLNDSRSLTSDIKGTYYTFHDYGRLPEDKRERIDYIFVNNQAEVKEYEVIPEKNEKGYFSDHSAVCARVVIK